MSLTGFHPTIRAWFAERLGEPTPPQREGWPLIREGRHVLIAAPTGSGKTLAAFLSAIDSLLHRGQPLADETHVLYVSPLKALSNDVQKNLDAPLAELHDRNLFLPEIRVLVRTGDTPASQRQAMTRRPPHILVTTPESLYILLTSESGRRMLKTVKTTIVDEIHALARDKRGSHLALSLERLEALAGPFQRIGLSATQKPLDEVARFLCGTGDDRECALVDVGHLRALDVAVELPPSPLSAVCSHEVWEEIYERMAALIREHKTTLVFANTRKMVERITARLTRILGEEEVASHHGSLSRARRLDAEQRLKAGKLRALVATASLELGIDVGDVDLAIQVGATRSIATFLQRVGRAGHAVRKVPKGRLFPLTIDELVEAAALLRAVRQGVLDRTPQPPRPLDILAQQVVAACVSEPWNEGELYDRFRRAWPYRDLLREDFDQVVSVHASGRRALLHRDGVNGRVMATRRARLTAITSGGAIPDTADYQVVQDPEGTVVGSVHEDFAVESNGGDVFQLGNTSWRVLRVEPGIVRVADAKGQPPTIPFWIGEAPSRTEELSAEIGRLRDECTEAAWVARETGVCEAAAVQIAEFVAAGRAVLGTVPTQTRVVLERFFDESGGMQLVVHAPFGGRINRAWGLALRKRFCRGFGFELQAAANEEAIVISLGPHHSFALDDVFDFLSPVTVREVLVQALLAAPMFTTRWRWNAQRSLLLDRMQNGKRVPAAISRMRAEDLLIAAFPQVLACPETLPPGDLPVPTEHPIVRQTVEDCLTEAMDLAGLVRVLEGLRAGTIERVAVDTPEPSAFARGILSSQPYTFLDDAPLEERRTQAVLARRVLDAKTSDEIGQLDPEAIARVREEAWPEPRSAEEVHEALLWMGFVTLDEGRAWQSWLDELRAMGRVVVDGDRWFATEATRDPKAVLRGRLEALGPIFSDEPLLLELEHEGVAMRARVDGRQASCDRRLLARIHRYTVERLRKEIEPVSAADYLRFLACWQHADSEHRLEGPRGVAEVVRQLAGFEVPAAAWEASVLPARVRGYKREWLDQLTLSGEAVWGRLWGGGASPIRTTPIALVLREDLDAWAALAPTQGARELSAAAREIHDALSARGAAFPQDLARATRLLPTQLEAGLGELISQGLLTCDSFAALRWLIVPPSRRRVPATTVGRWSLLRLASETPPSAEFVARQLLRRTGVVFRKTIAREKQPIPWRDLVRVFRSLETKGEIRGGRFVAGFDGEQYALPESVSLLRAVRRRGEIEPVSVSAADPLNFRGILTPDERVSPVARKKVLVA
ncbi:MAG: DEAD/DEAH box helicase [Planctomycetes bacterium]|nr:DEAD/DEAH box helicase [Planctomycetota bacterium]MBI3843387.1 DEAD/DEAH box helicase [Planctomycetota bacterium]